MTRQQRRHRERIAKDAVPNQPDILNRTLFINDNFKVMQNMEDEIVDMIYLDPPFNSQRMYINALGGVGVKAEQSFDDFWRMDKIKAEYAAALRNGRFDGVLQFAELSGGEALLAYTLYMIPRLVECHRILKRTGSLYFHCDDRVACVMEMVLSVIFGNENRRQNHLVWKRLKGAKNNVRWNYGRDLDHVLFYCKSTRFTFNVQYGPLGDVRRAMYRFNDNDGKGPYVLENVGVPKTVKGNQFGLGYGEKMPKYGYRYSEKDMRRMIAEGRIDIRRGKVPMRKFYLSESKGVPQSNFLTFDPDARTKRDTGWSTQKSLAMMECLVLSSTNEGDWVFDPFCGCATTMVAAEKQRRKWLGCDIDPVAEIAVKLRLDEEVDKGLLFDGQTLDDATIARTSLPLRVSPDKRQSPNIKQILYKAQGGRCAAPCCEESAAQGIRRGIKLPMRLFEVDHIKARNRGGGDEDSNLQLLCPDCNRHKNQKLWSEFQDEVMRRVA